jgi:poly(3-hydroxybutyrate) depolymerase
MRGSCAAAFLLVALLAACGGDHTAGTSPSGGCEAPAVPAGVTAGSIVVNGTTRTFTLAVPAGDARTARPLVFVFHGAGGDGAGIRGYLKLEAAAAGQAIFVYPDGLADGGSTGWPDTGGRDVAFFDALLAKLRAEACVDERSVFGTGFSYGGYMSNTLGCKRAGVVRAIAPLSGGGPWGGCNGAPVAAWIAHGTADSTVSLSQGAASRDHWRGANGCASTSAAVAPSPCVAFDGCGPNPVAWCPFDGGHTVPAWVGPAVWSFFDGLR